MKQQPYKVVAGWPEVVTETIVSCLVHSLTYKSIDCLSMWHSTVKYYYGEKAGAQGSPDTAYGTYARGLLGRFFT